MATVYTWFSLYLSIIDRLTYIQDKHDSHLKRDSLLQSQIWVTMSQEHRLRYPTFYTLEPQLHIFGFRINYLLTTLRGELLFDINSYCAQTWNPQMGLLFTRAVTWIRASDQFVPNHLDLPPQVMFGICFWSSDVPWFGWWPIHLFSVFQYHFSYIT